MNRIEADIAGTKIPLKVSEEEEVFVQRAIDGINSKIKEYQSEFSRMDIHDCVKMALLTYAVDYHKSHARALDEDSWKALLDIQKQLDDLDVRAIG